MDDATVALNDADEADKEYGEDEDEQMWSRWIKSLELVLRA
jgi:hypothetical protein